MLSREEIKAIPKIELHNHLEGMIRVTTIMDLCKQFNVVVPNINPANPDDLEPYRRHFLNNTKVENIEVFFNKFWEIQSLLRTTQVIERLAFEAVEDCYNQGVKLVEYRYSPSFINRSKYSDHSHLTFESVLEAILSGFRRATSLYDIAVGLIGIIDRSVPIEEEVAVFDFMMANKESFVAIDVANEEAFPCKPYAPWFQQARAAGLGLTCHAGESTVAESVREAIDFLDVTRIGHGFRSISDSTVLDLIKSKNVLLEICPLSNCLTGCVDSIELHPLRQLYDAGIRISINSDDAGVFDTTLCDEYELVAKYHGFGPREFLTCNLNALEASFLSDDVKDQIRRKYFST